MKKSLACRDSIIICEAAFPPYNPYHSAHSPSVCSSPPKLGGELPPTSHTAESFSQNPGCLSPARECWGQWASQGCCFGAVSSLGCRDVTYCLAAERKWLLDVNCFWPWFHFLKSQLHVRRNAEGGVTMQQDFMGEKEIICSCPHVCYGNGGGLQPL